MKIEIHNDQEFKVGCIVRYKKDLYMLGLDTSIKGYKLINLQTGEIDDYGYFGDINKFAKSLNLEFICNNENIYMCAKRR